ncbi:MAG: helix-turn-helix domain-containing protein [Ruminococcaceae bacterium]|nr:helix-turn-helix domain-containing protein [Oscillospiraceae bacterium]
MLNYSHSGRFTSVGDWIHPHFYLKTFEIIYVTKGEVYIEEDGQQFTLRENDVLLLHPYKNHAGFRYSRGVDFYWLHFMSDESFDFKCFSPRDTYEIISLIKTVLTITNTPGYPQTSFDAAMRMLTDALEFQNRNTLSATENEMLRKVYDYVRKNSDFNTTIEAVAERFGYSSGYISKLFKSKYNLGLKEYINSEQMKRAKNLLLNTQYSINEIAAELKFPDARAFIKFFTYHEKTSPLKYKNIHFGN